MNVSNEYIHTLGLQKRKPDLGFLTEINRRHASQFSFSSVGPLLGDELPLDTPSLYQRIVVRQRGGYCFEQNGLMYDVLKELGFSVNLYLARVIYNQDIHPGLTHRITLVEIDENQYVVDVGFGPDGPGRPVSMTGEPSHDGLRVFRVAQDHPGEFRMQTLKDEGFYTLYKFELTRYGQADCEIGHFYSHKHPSANFVNNLVVSRIMDHEIRSLRNREYRLITQSGEKQILIENAAHLKSILDDQFDVRITDAESERIFPGPAGSRPTR